jgi:hypothetical protein
VSKVNFSFNLSINKIEMFLAFRRAIREIPCLRVSPNFGVGPWPKTLAEGSAHGHNEGLVRIMLEELHEAINIYLAIDFEKMRVSMNCFHQSFV